MSEHDTAQHDSDQEGHEEHGASIKAYMMVFGALIVLTGGSFMTYFPFWDKHFSAHTGWAFMMAISCTKAMLVILFFMHLLYEANWKYVLTIPSIFMSIFLTLMLVPDVGMRNFRASEERLQNMAPPEVEGSHDDHPTPHKDDH